MPVSKFHENPPELVGVLSDEEIDLYLKGDRRDVDRLLLSNSNRLTALVLTHMRSEDERNSREDTLWESLGGAEGVKTRAAFVNTLIERQKDRNDMMKKVSQSTVVWALLAFAAFLATAAWEDAVRLLRTKLGG